MSRRRRERKGTAKGEAPPLRSMMEPTPTTRPPRDSTRPITSRTDPPVVTTSSATRTRSPGSIANPRRSRIAPSLRSANRLRTPRARAVSWAMITPPRAGPITASTRSSRNRPARARPACSASRGYCSSRAHCMYCPLCRPEERRKWPSNSTPVRRSAPSTFQSTSIPPRGLYGSANLALGSRRNGGPGGPPAAHQQARAPGRGLPRRHVAFLILRRLPFRPNAGNHRQKVRATHRFDSFYFPAGTDRPVHPGFPGHPCVAAHARLHRPRNAELFVQHPLIKTGELRDRHQPKGRGPGPIPRLPGSLHHRPSSAGVEGQQIHPQPGDGIHRPGDGVGNVVQLQIEKDVATPLLQPLHPAGAGGVKELHAHLDEGFFLRLQPGQKGFRLLRRRRIQGDDHTSPHPTTASFRDRAGGESKPIGSAVRVIDSRVASSANTVSREVRQAIPCSTASRRMRNPSRSGVLPRVQVFTTRSALPCRM